MNRMFGVVAGLLVTALTTVAVLFIIRQVGPAARVAGLEPAEGNPVEDLQEQIRGE